MDQNYIPTKKKNIRYKFATTLDDFRPKEEKRKTIDFFYQIAVFKNDNDKYHMRKFIIDSNNNFKNEDYFLNHAQFKRFFKIKKPNQYRMFNTKTLDGVERPSLNDIYTLKSENLSGNSNQLDSMYSKVTMDKIDYAKLYENRKRKRGNYFPTMDSIDNYQQDNENVISNFSKF